MTPNNTLTAINIQVQANQSKAISPDLFGIFFEDINYSADGGLYAELIQNRSFEYSAADYPDWNFFTGWELIQQRGKCLVAPGSDEPLNANNPHYLALYLENSQVGLRNTGFDGVVVKAGETYDISLFARTLSGQIDGFTVRLESRTGDVLGETTLPAPNGDWTKYASTIRSTVDDRHARFVLYISGTGALALDVISLFPQNTFKQRPNGLRADLAQVIADLKPRFIRFPGGCLVHGDGLDNMYRWKDTIGPIETRREQPNIWNYHQTMGLGYFEYFQFCEDIGAKPLPVVPAGVCCPNTGAKYTGRWEEGQQGLPMDEMADYVQEILDLIEWANGPVTSTWGAKRAEAGHPEPFNLEYLGLGNEERITPVFIERFKMIHDAVKAKHPEIVIIGTTGPRTEGEDYDEGWKLAREMKLDMVDEHGYRSPDWFWNNIRRFDGYDRDSSTVYLGEYAAHDSGRRNTLRSALSEAAYMTSLERNGDIVRLSSYAPLLSKQRRTQWLPDLIYFDNAAITPSLNYYAQQLFSVNAGDTYLPVDVNADESVFAMSCVRDSQTGDVILKLVNRGDTALPARIDVSGCGDFAPEAACTLLSGDAQAENVFGRPPAVLPQTTTVPVAPRFDYEIPAWSLSVIRLTSR